MFIERYAHMKKKIKRYKVGLNSETMAISLVAEPAIEVDFIHMSKDEESKQQVFLEKDDKYMVYGPVLIPDVDIYRNNGKQEFYINFSKESIEKMSQEFLKEYRQKEVTVDHTDLANEITVVESWLVADTYKDKANYLGFNVPSGTWMCSMKVNNVDTWNKIKSGELRGFSVESLISLEEFNKNNNMEIETDEMGFWTKMKSILTEVFTSTSLAKQDVDTEESEASKITPIEEKLEEETPTVEEPTVEAQNEPMETPQEPSKPSEPITTPSEVKEEPTEPKNEPTVEEKPNPLEELVKSLKDEVDALRKMNSSLDKKVKEMSKEPSVNPVNVKSKGVGGDNYAQWREQMRGFMS